ncbi:MAG: 2-oxoacid:ferredoxin oxidoreductase subunit beta [Pseudomonadota bacterium]
MNAPTKLTPDDFATDQEVRWCPGCGDYAILKAVHKTLPELGATRENTVFVSGIGCAARFPYYINTYGFHTIHGRAPAIATGVKLASPELNVWVVGGDGDSLSIGGNHLFHLLRRNVDVQYLMFNNEIYGLTKGQFSPTSRVGTKSPSTPQGSVDRPANGLRFALGAGARFVGRAIDVQQANLSTLLKRAHAHKGASFVEILQNCIVYNDDVFAHITDKKVAAEAQILVEHGKPLLFGKDKNRGVRLNPKNLTLEMVVIGENGVTVDDILVHDEKNRALAGIIAGMEAPFPVALGVIYCDPAESYEVSAHAQMDQAKAKNPKPDINKLLRSGNTWTVA